MISERFFKEEQEYKTLLENTTVRELVQPEVKRIVRYLKNRGYEELMEVTGMNRGQLYFTLNNPNFGDNKKTIYEIHELVKREFGLRGCYKGQI